MLGTQFLVIIGGFTLKLRYKITINEDGKFSIRFFTLYFLSDGNFGLGSKDGKFSIIFFYLVLPK